MNQPAGALASAATASGAVAIAVGQPALHTQGSNFSVRAEAAAAKAATVGEVRVTRLSAELFTNPPDEEPIDYDAAGELRAASAIEECESASAVPDSPFGV